MKQALLLLVSFAIAAGTIHSGEKDMRVYELRTYWAPEGKLDDLHTRFRDHTIKLFDKHGMTNVGYWVPLENPDRKLIYLLSFPSKDAAAASWAAFRNDPQWKDAKAKSEAKGTLVAKVESLFLNATDYSPEVKPGTAGDRVFEMRTYQASPGNLDHLNARFRDHTLKLFAKHGMTNLGYYVPLKDQKGADNTLVYFLAHRSREAAKESFGAFGKDSAWVAARKASEKNAGGPLTVKGGVQSLFLKATDYSPIR